ncbi:alanine racemase [Asanoa hainanensis]|uniref:Alanine racemase n=1 Tax=Asanoa hainanensis TaxID=560556 RepID=A0A239K0C2_9ACTN|nr:alanine racemase [Asanoa hainanensis]SNT11756.1 alanine racemase [Asanoa hainanensis]
MGPGHRAGTVLRVISHPTTSRGAAPPDAPAIRALAEAEIDLDAVTANARAIAEVTGTDLMAVVKADGFGHGAVPVARAALAGGATWLGVTSAAEALALRAGGISAPVLSWLHHPDDDFGPLLAAGVDLGISTMTHLRAAAAGAARLRTTAMVQLKVDTGLSRNGARGTDWADLVALARAYEMAGSVKVRGVWSHLADADQPGSPLVRRQVTAFRTAVRVARAAKLDPVLLHLANSAGALTAPATRFDIARIGLALYGVEPVAGAGTGLRPAMTLRSSVVNLKRVPAGTGVSYGPDHVTAEPTTLALVPVGFADGIPRAAQGRAEVWVGGARCPIVGRITMDQCVVDVGDRPVRLGDPVTIFGPGPDEPTVAEWARWAGTNPNDLLTGIGPRVARRYLGVAA